MLQIKTGSNSSAVQSKFWYITTRNRVRSNSSLDPTDVIFTNSNDCFDENNKKQSKLIFIGTEIRFWVQIYSLNVANFFSQKSFDPRSWSETRFHP